MPGEKRKYSRRILDEVKWLDIYYLVLGRNNNYDCFLFYKGVFKKGTEMKKCFFGALLSIFVLSNCVGCLPLLIGGAAGALGAYVVSKDTIEGDTDKPYDRLWPAVVSLARAKGTVKVEDSLKGYIDFVDASSSKVQIRLIRVTRLTTRIRISARKNHLPNLALAQDLFVRIIDEAR